MKHSSTKKTLALFLLLLIINQITSNNSSTKEQIKENTNFKTNLKTELETEAKIQTDLQTHLTKYSEGEAKTFTKFAKLANCASKPLNINCPKCLNPGKGYKFYFFYQTTRINKFNYKIMIHYNDLSKKILVSFAGPSANEHVYIKYIYSAGFSLVKKYNFQVEKEFYQIYFRKLRKILKQKLLKIRSSGRKNFQVYFTGHSIGGSLATLAAFDLKKSKVVKDVKVFSIAPLRLGDATYVAMVNSLITVYRIVKRSDYLVRIPNCYYSDTYHVWRCFNEKIIKSFILKPTFPLKVYVSSYLTYYKRSNTILRSAIVYARKRIALRKSNLVVRKKSNKLAHRDLRIKNLNKKISELKKKNNSIKKVVKSIKHKIHNEKDLKKFNTKRIQKKTNGITNQLKKLKKKKVGKKTSKRLKKLIKNGKNMNKKQLKKKPKLLKKKVKNFFKKVKKVGKNIYKRAKELLKKKKNKTNLQKLKNLKKLKHLKKLKKHQLKRSRNKKNKNKAKKPIKKLTPVKFFKNKKKVKTILTKSYTYIPKVFKVYSPIQTYFTFVYYTQPIGYQIFYNDSMTEYTTCQYVNGISLCEKVFQLPLQFGVSGHMNYFGIDLDKC